MNTELIATNMLKRAERQVAQVRYIQKQKVRTLAIIDSIQAQVDDIHYDVQALIDNCMFPMNLTKDEIKQEAGLAAFIWSGHAS